MKSYRRKRFKGLVRYAQARLSAHLGWKENLKSLEKHYTPLEMMEARSHMWFTAKRRRKFT